MLNKQERLHGLENANVLVVAGHRLQLGRGLVLAVLGNLAKIALGHRLQLVRIRRHDDLIAGSLVAVEKRAHSMG